MLAWMREKEKLYSVLVAVWTSTATVEVSLDSPQKARTRTTI